MKKIFPAILILILSSTYCGAQSKMDDIKTLIEVLNLHSLMDSTINIYLDAFSKLPAFNPNNSDPDERKEFLRPIFKRVFAEYLDSDVVKVYDIHFSQDEIREIIKFYLTDSGKKFIQEQIPIQKELTNIMIQKYLPKIEEEIRNKLNEKQEKYRDSIN